MLKELTAFLFFTCIIAIIFAVSIPSLILEPVSWMLNTDIEVHKYGNAVLGNQNTSFFDFYILSGHGTYTEISIVYIALLFSIIFIPFIMLLLTLLSIHFKAKSKAKELRQSYLSSFFEAFFKGNIKPSFWLIFCPLAVLIYIIKTQYHQEVLSVTNYNFSFLDTRKIYKPAILTNHNDQSILWETVFEEKKPDRFTKNEGSFSKVNSYIAYITAKEADDDIVFSFNTNSNSSSVFEFIDPYIIIVNKDTVSAVNTKNFQVIDSLFIEQAKKKNPRLGDIFKISYAPKTRIMTFIDNYENKVDISINNVLNITSNNKLNIKPTLVKSDSNESRQYIKPEEIIKNKNFKLIKYKSDLTRKKHDFIAFFDTNHIEKWNYSLSSYTPYLEPFEKKDCKYLHASHTEMYIAISYQFIGISCATEFIDKKSGKLIARFKAGNLEYY